MILTRSLLEKGFLRVVSVSLCLSVVKLLGKTLTTATQRSHREPQRRILLQTSRICLLLPTSLVLSVWCSAQTQLTVKTINKIPIARSSQTIELSAKVLAALGEKDLNKIHVRDSSGKEVLAQAVDTDYDELRSEEHTSELQSLTNIVCRLLLEKKKQYSFRLSFAARPKLSVRSQRTTARAAHRFRRATEADCSPGTHTRPRSRCLPRLRRASRL